MLSFEHSKRQQRDELDTQIENIQLSLSRMQLLSSQEASRVFDTLPHSETFSGKGTTNIFLNESDNNGSPPAFVLNTEIQLRQARQFRERFPLRVAALRTGLLQSEEPTQAASRDRMARLLLVCGQIARDGYYPSDTGASISIFGETCSPAQRHAETGRVEMVIYSFLVQPFVLNKLTPLMRVWVQVEFYRFLLKLYLAERIACRQRDYPFNFSSIVKAYFEETDLRFIEAFVPELDKFFSGLPTDLPSFYQRLKEIAQDPAWNMIPAYFNPLGEAEAEVGDDALPFFSTLYRIETELRERSQGTQDSPASLSTQLSVSPPNDFALPDAVLEASPPNYEEAVSSVPDEEWAQEGVSFEPSAVHLLLQDLVLRFEREALQPFARLLFILRKIARETVSEMTIGRYRYSHHEQVPIHRPAGSSDPIPIPVRSPSPSKEERRAVLDAVCPGGMSSSRRHLPLFSSFLSSGGQAPGGGAASAPAMLPSLRCQPML